MIAFEFGLSPPAMFGAAFCLVAAVAALMAAALHDLAVRTVPNALVGVVMLGGAGVAAADDRLLFSLLTAGLVLAATVLLWLRGLLGGGDAKLLPAACLLVPPDAVPWLIAAVAAAGLVVCLPYLPGRRLFRPPSGPRPPLAGRLTRAWRCERRRLSRRGPLPYAVAIAAGTFMSLSFPLAGG